MSYFNGCLAHLRPLPYTPHSPARPARPAAGQTPAAQDLSPRSPPPTRLRSLPGILVSLSGYGADSLDPRTPGGAPKQLAGPSVDPGWAEL
ncbi:hypothetical protein NDU88_006109 [Pleurodeles waltl]|uniref:Uncharacterized protein n=1 Tax=Pleurodeles waltl TaxID=8319 RepID=A0AAV7QK90_PLEWA|nr:hypothetical protein NDU88_006109 [Pleurodeles waltl]